MNVTLSVKTSGALLSGRAPEIVQGALDQAVISATLLLDTKIKGHTPQGVYGAQGGLIASIQHEVLGRGTPLIKGVVKSAHPYLLPIEKGRTPGKAMPPEGSLLRWIEVKMGLDPAAAKKIEYVVRRKIKVKGFKGARMFEKGFNDSWPQIQRMFDGAGLRIVRELNQ